MLVIERSPRSKGGGLSGGVSLAAGKRSSFDETRSSPLLEADIDDIEVLRDDRLGEDCACLARRLRAEVAVREVCEREHRDTRLARESRGVRRGRVCGFARTLPLLVEE